VRIVDDYERLAKSKACTLLGLHVARLLAGESKKKKTFSYLAIFAVLSLSWLGSWPVDI
jgi:hypothetical protein